MGFSKKDLGDVVWSSETGRDTVFLTSRPKDIDYPQLLSIQTLDRRTTGATLFQGAVPRSQIPKEKAEMIIIPDAQLSGKLTLWGEGDFATQNRTAEAQALSKIRQPRQGHDDGHFRHPQQ